jgi:chromosomal replication initiator protein
LNQTVWNQVLQSVESKLSKPSFETWLKYTELKEIDEEHNQATIIAQNEFARDWVETRYSSLLEDLLYEATNTRYAITVISGDVPDLRHERGSILKDISLPIKENYTFSNFTINSGNRFACAAAKAVAAAPGKAYNPLTIHGPSGSGKTYLLHAIANEVVRENPEATVLYLSADHFANRYIASFRTANTDRLRETLCQADVLLFDELDTLASKEQSQEFLFNIFNYLFLESKQIVFASSEDPNKISGLSEQIKARCSWGLLTEVTDEREKVVALTAIKNQSDNITRAVDQLEVRTSETSIDLLKSLLAEQKQTNKLLEQLLEVSTCVQKSQ